MDLTYCNEEKVVKTFDLGVEHGNITVTDKRLVSTVKHKKGIDRKEVPLSTVKSVDVYYGPIKKSTGKKVAIWLLMIYGIAALIASLVGAIQVKNAPAVGASGLMSQLSGAYAGLGIALLVIAFILLIPKKGFILNIRCRAKTNYGLGDGAKSKIPVGAIITTIVLLVVMRVVTSLMGNNPYANSLMAGELGGIIVIMWAIILIKRLVQKKKKKKRKKLVDGLKINVSENVAIEIAEELGAAMLGA